MNKKRVQEILSKAANKTLLVVGDVMLDRFIWGTVDRISPEAPVPVVAVTQETAMPGGAANVARNIATLGCKVELLGLTGGDIYGNELLSYLKESSVGCSSILQSTTIQTTVKTRVIAHNQQVVRVDRDPLMRLPNTGKRKLTVLARKAVQQCDAVIIEDYGKGVIFQELVDVIVSQAVQRQIPVAVDPKKGRRIDYSGVTAVTPNYAEALYASGLDDIEELKNEEIGQALLTKWACEALVMTMGNRGMILFQKGRKPLHIPTVAQEVYDVSGAGDTVISAFTACLCAGGSFEEAARLANTAGGISVGKLGTAVVYPEEILKRWNPQA